jgi:hypothetical protein
VKVPAQFKTDFDLVTSHYGIAGAELAECKGLVEKDFDAAEEHYRTAASRIRVRRPAEPPEGRA